MLRLEALDQELAVCRLDGDSPVPNWLAGEITAIVRRRDELSVVCAADAVPEGVDRAGPFRALMVLGQLDLDEVGILHGLTGPLAEAEVPVFVLSTFDTDLVLVPDDRLDKALPALAAAGYEVTGS